MVTLTEIAVAYGEQVVLDDVSLTIDRGARIALCGANGSGKSTLMRVIAGQASADSGRVIAKRGVSIAYLVQSGVEHGGRTLREELVLAFTRELAAEQKLRSIEELMAETGDAGELDRLLARYGELGELVSPDGPADRAARLDRVSRGLGFGPGAMDQDTATFSSGWQMRIALAKLLAGGLRSAAARRTVQLPRPGGAAVAGAVPAHLPRRLPPGGARSHADGPHLRPGGGGLPRQAAHLRRHVHAVPGTA